MAEKADPHGPMWGGVSGWDLNIIGHVIVGLFFAAWVIALPAWKVGRIGRGGKAWL
ncbi:hypothetical protein AB0D38_03345 [Streptomyces sp. NPDC048279]|uniref:hypothetical protein n=1 Tax=Streptomyces sp. NPDC048279 TaxID=3154714 RepID=UPI0034312882